VLTLVALNAVLVLNSGSSQWCVPFCPNVMLLLHNTNILLYIVIKFDILDVFSKRYECWISVSNSTLIISGALLENHVRTSPFQPWNCSKISQYIHGGHLTLYHFLHFVIRIMTPRAPRALVKRVLSETRHL
jgi:hypothetical protein